MVGPMRTAHTNFHSVADLATSSSTPYSRVAALRNQYSRPFSYSMNSPTPLKVKMEPSPAESLIVTSPSVHKSPSIHSPTISEDSGYSAEASPSLVQVTLPTLQTTPPTQRLTPPPGHTPLSHEDPRKYRKQRSVFETAQLKALEETFNSNAYPSSEEYEDLAERVSIDEARLRIWFQNRRARHRRSSKQTDTGSKTRMFSLTTHNMSHPQLHSNHTNLSQLHSHMMLLGPPHPLLYATGL